MKLPSATVRIFVGLSYLHEGISEVAARGAQLNPTLDHSSILKSNIAIRRQQQQRTIRPNKTIPVTEIREFDYDVTVCATAMSSCRES